MGAKEKSPFIFDKIVTGSSFVGRDNELTKLFNNFRDSVNTFIVSPRRTGKTSLVKHASDLFIQNNKEYSIVHINLWNIRTEAEFYEMLASKVLKATSSKLEELLQNTKEMLSRLNPSIDLEHESVKINISAKPQKAELDNILNLPQKIAEKRNKKIIICIDEFQDIEYYDNSLSFQKKLRSYWQQHNDVSYVLYGSKQHMLSNLFNNSSMPFYRFGDVMFLKKIEEAKLTEFICNNFNKTGKSISKTDAKNITQMLNRHPYYIQQFCNVLWQNTYEKVTTEIKDKSMEEFIGYNAGQFELMISSLSNTQFNFLKALCNKEEAFHSQHVMATYKLGSSANVTSVKKALIEKEIIHSLNSKYYFTDPAFEIFFNTRVMQRL